MFDESKLIFFTGAPGSKWSAVSHLLTKQTKYPINTSDYQEDRQFDHVSHKFFPTSHLGAYFGPGQEFGNDFHILDTLSKEEIVEEIDKAYKDKGWDKYRIVKCHHFSRHLRFITETFPKSKIITVHRPAVLCYRGWQKAGGFDHITYPDYSYYQDLDFMKEEITRENVGIMRFWEETQCDVHLVRSRYWKDRWDIDVNQDEETKTYSDSIEYERINPEVDDSVKPVYYVLIGEYNL